MRLDDEVCQMANVLPSAGFEPLLMTAMAEQAGYDLQVCLTRCSQPGTCHAMLHTPTQHKHVWKCIHSAL